MIVLQYLPILNHHLNDKSNNETTLSVVILIIIVFMFVMWLVYNFDKLNK